MINLYSDTQSQPTPAMRKAIFNAPVGDEQKGTDPTVERLLNAVAARLGKQAAIFLPSGTMCNAVAVAAHCSRGEAVVTEAGSHLMRYEAGGLAALSGAIPEAITGNDGQFSADELRAHFHAGSRYTPATTLVSVEQSCNLAGGTVWPVRELQNVALEARTLGMKSHMDGARLFNAEIATGQPAAEHCAEFDSVWIDFTKGLGAPFGAVLCGSPQFIDRAWAWKHRFGGAMRQAGMMAGACLYALENNIGRLRDDHANAQRFNEGLKRNPRIVVKHQHVATNIVYFALADASITSDRFISDLMERGLKIGFVGTGFRVVTYPGIEANDIDQALKIVDEALDEMNAQPAL